MNGVKVPHRAASSGSSLPMASTKSVSSVDLGLRTGKELLELVILTFCSLLHFLLLQNVLLFSWTEKLST